MNLEKHVSATLPREGHLRGYVRGSQLDEGGNSKLPVEDSASGWDAEAGRFRLRHTKADHASGLRAFFIDIMEALKCHQDVSIADGNSALRAYVAKYVSKFSDSMQSEWLNDAAEANSIAATVLSRCH